MREVSIGGIENSRGKVRLVVALLLLVLSGIANRVYASGQDFTMVIFPDTQYLVYPESEKWPLLYKWVVENKIPLDIRAVLSVGDIIDTGSEKDFRVASAGFTAMENAGIPCLPIVGNHDYDGRPENRNLTHFNAIFGPARFANKGWYGGGLDGSNANYYITVTIGNRKFLMLALELFPRKKSVAWASKIIDSNTDAEIIVLTHGYLNPDGSRTKNSDLYGPASYLLDDSSSGDDLWNSLIKEKPNIRAVICGHQLGATNTAYSEASGDNGNTVHQIFVNYQDTRRAWVGLLSFHTSQNTVEVSFLQLDGSSGPTYDLQSPKYTLIWDQIKK